MSVADVVKVEHPPVLAAQVNAEFFGVVKHDGWPNARPEWDDLTVAEHDEHRQECLDSCSLCDGHRGWGVCPACGHGDAEANDAGDSTCCHARVLFGAEAERAWVA